MKISQKLLSDMRATGWDTVPGAAKKIGVFPSTVRRWADRCHVTSTVRNGTRFVKMDSVNSFAGGGQ